MTPTGAKHIIDALSIRIFEIQDARVRLAKEEGQLRARIQELEQGSVIVPTPVVVVD